MVDGQKFIYSFPAELTPKEVGRFSVCLAAVGRDFGLRNIENAQS